jgi:hypothetical protein
MWLEIHLFISLYVFSNSVLCCSSNNGVQGVKWVSVFPQNLPRNPRQVSRYSDSARVPQSSVRIPAGARDVFSPKRPDWLSAHTVFYLPRLRISGTIPQLTIHLQGVKRYKFDYFPFHREKRGHFVC